MYGPTKIRERTRNNAISNDRRAKKARIISGGSLGHGDSEGVAEETPDIDVGAQENGTLASATPSFATQNPASFADSQHVTPAPGSLPLKMEPPHTPKKSEPPVYNGAMHNELSAQASPPNPLLPEFLNYDYDPSYYSAGQYRPDLDGQVQLPISDMQLIPGEQQIDLTGEDPTSAPGQHAAANTWLHRRRDSDH